MGSSSRYSRLPFRQHLPGKQPHPRCDARSCGTSSSARGPMILAGDIGGTKCNLALFGEQGVVLRPVFQRRYSTRDYAHLQFEDLIEDFIRQATGQIGRASCRERAEYEGVTKV